MVVHTTAIPTLIEILKIPVANEGPSPEQVKNRLRRAERELIEARLATEKLGLNVQEPKATAQAKPVSEEPTMTRAKREEKRYAYYRQKPNQEASVNNEEAVADKFNAGSAEEKASMIVAAAARLRPKRK
jgi:hypothetical protein